MKIAVIGSGHWGRNLVRVFSELGVLHTVCDIDTDRLRQINDTYPSVKTAPSYADVLNTKEIDAVAISTPAVTHYTLAKEGMLSGKDVFVEKPISLTLDQATELVTLSKKENRILMVGHLLEYHPGILKLKELMDKGELGRVYYIYSTRLNLGKIRREENILWSFAPHDISVMLLLLTEMPVSVSAHGGNYLHKDIADVTVSNLEFASGVKGHIFVSWLHPYKEQKLIVVGDKKMALFDDVAGKDKILLYNHKIELRGKVPVAINAPAEIISFSPSEPLKDECKHFLQCIRTREKPKTDGYNGVKVLRVLRACQRSLERNGEEIKVGSEFSRSQNFYIHPSATVEGHCDIGEGTKIWHYSHIMKGAKMGKNCQIGQNVFVGSRAEIGNGVKIQNNVSVYDCVKLEDGVFCGPSTVFTNVINPRSHVSRKHEFKETLVKKGATLGANSTVLCGITIGEYAFIGAGAVVTKDVPPYALVYGNPAGIKGWVCECGVKLQVIGQRGTCKACGKGILIECQDKSLNKLRSKK